tara:strand:- start:119 stop:460 length:342 start_codon:yes stop_codon:yes gene_type:complete
MAQAITATKDDSTATIEYNFGENVQEAIEMFGEDVVFAGFTKSAKITAQSAIRRYLTAGVDEDGIQEKMNSWKPGVALERVSDPVSAIKNKFANLDDDAKLELIKQLKASAGK